MFTLDGNASVMVEARERVGKRENNIIFGILHSDVQSSNYIQAMLEDTMR